MMDGYHSPQVSVDVRLNTNESPLPPPQAFLDAVAAQVAVTDWHRYPDRQATELRSRLAAVHGVAPDLDEVRRVIAEHRPSITYLCSPNNPTGMVESAETVTEVLDLVEGIGG